MGEDSIEAGSRDSWTITPKVIVAAAKAAAVADSSRGPPAASRNSSALFHNPAKRDPRGYILPSNQPDFLTATKFVNTLLGNGVKVHRATADFEVAGKKYPKGSYVVKMRPGLSAPRAGHVRAAGPSRRHSLSRAHRRRRLTTRPDGRWPTRCGINSIASWTASTARWRSSRGLRLPLRPPVSITPRGPWAISSD